MILNQVLVSFFVFLNDIKRFGLQGPLKKLLKTAVVHFVLLKVYSKIPINDIKEDFLKLIQFLDVNETALTREKVV